MSIELTLFNLAAVAVAFIGALWTLVVIIAKQQEKSLENRFKGLNENLAGVNKSIEREQDTTRRLERDLMELRVELSRDYVRREDFVREFGIVVAKIDNMALRVESALRNGRSQP